MRRLLSSVARYLPFQYNGTTLAISKLTVGFVPAAVSGTPAQHALYQENVAKVWGNVSITPTLNDSFNMTSVADGGTGLVTITFDRDFANSTYSIVATSNRSDSGISTVKFTSLGVTDVTATIFDSTTAADFPFCFVAYGKQ